MDHHESAKQAEAQGRRLEEFWKGAFGDAYTSRNALSAGAGCGDFWRRLLAGMPIHSVLEIGCNVGGNLKWISDLLPSSNVVGVDINEGSLQGLAATVPKAIPVRASSQRLPFRDNEFDLTFTFGTLVCHHPDTLPRVMREIFRTSRRYLLCVEAYSEHPVEVPYRGVSDVLWKLDFGGLYQKLFPELHLSAHGLVAHGNFGWDDLTYWLFEKMKLS
ncbi:MAG: pseudaminic acid biosynthesis-associated methylase [Actinomycetota bacterium]